MFRGLGVEGSILCELTHGPTIVALSSDLLKP